jgi:Skp family chaperone for outer membrane proteins
MNRTICSILITGMLLFSLASAQAAQKNESDLAFIARMNQQASDMYATANKLDASLTAIDRKSDGKKKRDRLQSELKSIKANIREEQKHLDGKEFKKGQSRKEQNRRMQKIKERLRVAEREIAALN